MRKVALVFVLAIWAPALILAWLAIGSLRDQQVVFEREQARLCQEVTDALTERMRVRMAEKQRQFEEKVEALLAQEAAPQLAQVFDERLRGSWPLAEVGFAVTIQGQVCAPSLLAGAEAQKFRRDNELFLSNKEIAEVYLAGNRVPQMAGPAGPNDNIQQVYNEPFYNSLNLSQQARQQEESPQVDKQEASSSSGGKLEDARQKLVVKGNKARSVSPQQGWQQPQGSQPSKTLAAEAEFRQLIGDNTSGAIARFLQNKLKLMLWYRSARDRNIVFGAQLQLPQLAQELGGLLTLGSHLQEEISVALLDDMGRVLAWSDARGKTVGNDEPAFAPDWKHPFVSTEVGEILPHWEVAAHLRHPERIAQSVQTLKLTVGMVITVLILAIAVGGWLIVADLRRQMVLARQKSDFVSNVSHELKTPLTSIRMFSELLAEERVEDPGKRRDYLQIISAEAARLTRLINNVLDFSRIERGEKKYEFKRCNLSQLVSETLHGYGPRLEAAGYKLGYEVVDAGLEVQGDRDALSQVVLNLLSNAEKYSGDARDIFIRVARAPGPVAQAGVAVMDRGAGVPAGLEQKIFEQFYRAHDSLNSGIQGSGLGLTLARQIARAHDGDVTYSPREGGGSCFTLELPIRHAT